MEKLCLKVFLFVGLFLHFVKDMPYALSDKEARLSEVFSPGGDDKQGQAHTGSHESSH